MLTWSNLRRQGRRLVSAAIAIVIGITFGTATMVFGDSLQATVEEEIGRELSPHAVVVSPTKQEDIPEDLPRRLDAVPGADQVVVTRIVWGQLAGGTTRGVTLPPPGSGEKVTAGRLPRTSGEAAVTPAVASARHLEVGEKITFGGYSSKPMTLTVVGIVDVNALPSYRNTPSVLMVGEDVVAVGGHVRRITVDSTSGATAEQLKAAISPLAPKVRVETGAEATATDVKEAAHGTQIFTGVFLAFALVALAVAGLVIANTFTIVLAQRTRQLAMLRLVGATRQQLFRSVLGEAALLGGLASALGTLLGVGAAYGVRSAFFAPGSPMPLTRFSITPTAVLVPLCLGILVTVVTALLPARRATRVVPMAALRPQGEPQVASRGGVVRLVLGTLAVLGGTTLLVISAGEHELVMGVLGGLVSFGGVILLTPFFLPLCVAGLARLLRPLGLTADLAGQNARRNRSRTAATASALLIGVTLVTMMVTAAATVQRSVDDEMASRYPVDAQVEVSDGVPASLVGALRGVDGVAAVAPMRSLDASAPERPGLKLLAMDPAEARATFRDAGLAEHLVPGTLAVPKRHLGQWTDGQQVQVKGPQGSLSLTIHEAETGTMMITAADAEQLAPGTRPTSVAVRAVDGADPVETMAGLSAASAGTTGATVVGMLAEKKEITRALDMVLAVVVALLAVAVVIALVGITNTLSLSVLERGQENGMLRALGLTRRQMRGVVGIEAVLIGLVAAVVGIGLGIGYGYAGVLASATADIPVHLTVPGVRLGAVVLVAVVAAGLASVLPAWRAAKVAPVRALAAE